mmetsp:Transcript_3428/g.3386  ORF Transcript_3428/g.3386 Transcript_3428/m.3386 type:complete len:80 (-) Transcript_3428:1046-1285(-)
MADCFINFVLLAIDGFEDKRLAYLVVAVVLHKEAILGLRIHRFLHTRMVEGEVDWLELGAFEALGLPAQVVLLVNHMEG